MSEQISKVQFNFGPLDGQTKEHFLPPDRAGLAGDIYIPAPFNPDADFNAAIRKGVYTCIQVTEGLAIYEWQGWH